MTAEQTVYGLVRFEGEGRRIEKIVVAFESAAAADLFARAAGIEDYEVGPVWLAASAVLAESGAGLAGSDPTRRDWWRTAS